MLETTMGQEVRFINRCGVCRAVWFLDFEPEACTCETEHFTYEIYEATRIPVYWEIVNYGDKPVGTCWVSVLNDTARFEKFSFIESFKIPWFTTTIERKINDSPVFRIVAFQIGPSYGPIYGYHSAG